MDPNNTAASFQSTIWSLVLGAAGRDRASLEHLLRAYWSPVYAFIRRQGYSGHDASDLTQEFLTQVVLGRDLAARANPEKGRFRSFMKQALRNFLIDQHRMGRHHKGHSARHQQGVPASEAGERPERSDGDRFKPAHPAAAVSMNDPSASHYGSTIPDTSNPETDAHFDREWAAAVIEQTLDKLEEACLADGMEGHWEAFSLNVLGPALRGTRPVPMDELAKRVGAIDATQASNMLQTIKRRFRRTLREVISETVADSANVEPELSELKSFFGGSVN